MRGFQESTDFQKAILRVLNLEKNKLKGDWKRCSPLFLLWLKIKEDVEVIFAIVSYMWAERRYQYKPHEDNLEKLHDAKEHLLSEVADSGAFGMMIADVCGALGDNE